ncbi:MAG: alanine racemase [Woeseiaceae bacterium]|nr:alanine racemase [Woeseiaceae bacterium]
MSPAALTHNLDVIRGKAPGCRLMAAVKGNAYGHGLLTAARCFAAADAFAVARLVEAETLRNAGITRTLVLLSGVLSREELDRALASECALVVHNEVQLDLLERSTARHVPVWLKVDSGMHRLGFAPAACPAALGRLRAAPAVGEIGLMTHLACADDVDDPLTAAQHAAFAALCEGFDGPVSGANSPALFSNDGAWRDPARLGHRGATWVRPGIALYGISPFPVGCGADLGLRPAMTLETRLLDVKRIGRGERVGYGGHWRAPARTWLGIIAAGYGDGYTRFLPSGTPVLINGRRVPLAGTVSMDLAAVDLGPEADDCVGDTALLWGPALPVEEIARRAGTIAYQLVTGLTHREPPLVAD